MKRIISMIMLYVLAFALTACGSSEPEHILEFNDGRLVVVDERELVAVFCTYTNASNESCLPCDGINVKAYQNGIEIPVMVYTGQETEGHIQCDTSVQAGAKANVVWLFEPTDESTVTVEFTDGQKHSFEIAAE